MTTSIKNPERINYTNTNVRQLAQNAALLLIFAPSFIVAANTAEFVFEPQKNLQFLIPAQDIINWLITQTGIPERVVVTNLLTTTTTIAISSGYKAVKRMARV